MRRNSGFLGALIILIVLAAAVYVGFWLCLVGGIVQLAEGCKADPTSSYDIAFGVIRIGCTSVVFWITILGGISVVAAWARS